MACASRQTDRNVEGEDRLHRGEILRKLPWPSDLNVMRLATPQSAIFSALVFNAVIFVLLIPLALCGVRFLSDQRRGYRNPRDLWRKWFHRAVIGIKSIDLCLPSVL
jgi:high-affinity K+ transport system ATPase subunit B